MSETRITAAFGGVALVLLIVTWATAPRVTLPRLFAERGQLLFPAFRDPNAAASLEIIELDARDAAIRPFKVQNRNGRWTVPSQHDYPADAKDRLAQTAAAIVALRRDDVASDSAADHERCGVLDPLDRALPGVGGRGTRLIVRGEQDQVLADVILGKPVEGRPAFRYVRQPGQRRVYVSNVGDLQISTAFADWIERDLLQVGADEIDAVNLRNYSLDRGAGRTSPGETMLLRKDADGAWTINGLAEHEELDRAAVDALLRNLARLTIVEVLPKPAGITAALGREMSSTLLSPEDRADLGRKGFYLGPGGQLVSNRGELVVRTIRGVFYTLRFGDIAPGIGLPAGPAAAENRFLFIMVNFDPGSADTPGHASEGAEKVRALRSRFAPWYYVIAADSFDAIRVQRRNLVRRRVTG